MSKSGTTYPRIHFLRHEYWLSHCTLEVQPQFLKPLDWLEGPYKLYDSEPVEPRVNASLEFTVPSTCPEEYWRYQACVLRVEPETFFLGHCESEQPLQLHKKWTRVTLGAVFTSCYWMPFTTSTLQDQCFQFEKDLFFHPHSSTQLIYHDWLLDQGWKDRAEQVKSMVILEPRKIPCQVKVPPEILSS